MTLSNKITISRLVLVVVMLLVLFLPIRDITTIFNLNLGELLFAIIFTIASFTDFLDGYLARKRNEVTTFGKFLDPVADKVLVLSGMLYIVVEKTNYDWWWVLIVVVLLREFSVQALRMLAAKDKVIAAGFSGKLKTVVMMVAMILILFNGFGLYHIMGENAHYVTDVLFYLGVLLTAISGIDYLYKNKDVINVDK